LIPTRLPRQKILALATNESIATTVLKLPPSTGKLILRDRGIWVVVWKGIKTLEVREGRRQKAGGRRQKRKKLVR